MSRIVSACILLAMGPLVVSAEPLFEVSVEMTKSELFPGEPLIIYLDTTNASDSESDDYTVMFYSRYHLTVTLLDKNGKVLGMRPAEPWYPNGSGFLFDRNMEPGDVFRKSMILHRWHSTWLEPGNYTLAVEVKSLLARMGADPKAEYEHLSGFPKNFRFPIAIQERDDDRVKALFGRILKTAHRVPRTEEEEREKRLADDTIIFAQGPLALPYQLKLIETLYAEDKRFEASENRYLEMFRCIAHSGDVETAKELVAFANSPIFDPYERKAKEEGMREAENSDRYGAWKYLVFAIYELHSTGDPDIVSITRPFTELVAPPTGMQQFNYLDGGSGRQEDY